MKNRFTICAIAAVVMSAASAQAKAYYAPIDVMIAEADAIAVIDILALEPLNEEESGMRFKDLKASVSVEQTIKGDLAGTSFINIPIFFPCAAFDVAPGRYLVFLAEREGVMTNSNWHVSLRPVTDGLVSWYAQDTRDFEDVPLEEVVGQIKEGM